MKPRVSGLLRFRGHRSRRTEVRNEMAGFGATPVTRRSPSQCLCVDMLCCCLSQFSLSMRGLAASKNDFQEGSPPLRGGSAAERRATLNLFFDAPFGPTSPPGGDRLRVGSPLRVGPAHQQMEMKIRSDLPSRLDGARVAASQTVHCSYSSGDGRFGGAGSVGVAAAATHRSSATNRG